MGVKYNPKRDRHIDAAKAAAIKLGVDGLAPEILFGGPATTTSISIRRTCWR